MIKNKLTECLIQMGSVTYTVGYLQLSLVDVFGHLLSTWPSIQLGTTNLVLAYIFTFNLFTGYAKVPNDDLG